MNIRSAMEAYGYGRLKSVKYKTERIEFKSQWSEAFCKEVIAFANSDGGYLYIGVDDTGTQVGVADVDETYNLITNVIRDSILPDITMFIKYTLQENHVICLEISEGANKPYYLHRKGLKPSGVYVRQGSSSVPASPEQIRQMIRNADGDAYEDMRSLVQDLTFKQAKETFAQKSVAFQKEQFPRLGMCDLSGLFTNVGLLLSDQCEHSIMVAVYADEAKTLFKDTREFKGSVLKQLESTYSYLMLCNQNQAKITGLDRVDRFDYPAEAIREALLNAIVHRDYAYSGSIIINIIGSQMEFISIGGLVSGLTIADIGTGISQPRNRHLADIFHRLGFVESYGTGVRKIHELYKDFKEPVRIEVTPNTFKMILPNQNKTMGKESDVVSAKEPLVNRELSPQTRQIFDQIIRNGFTTDEEVQKLLGIKKTRAYILVKQMIDAGLLEVRGRGIGKKYLIKAPSLDVK
ncbi:RNA-binding domain-containing protein [Sphaerochaeta pleomorpha]|uniref:RNA-binding domain-containing protein n=1 Tax=Sphaerochaeta pleomorpha TaxID=1131707 RepID=UPI001FE0D1CA|nr:RNA-binding domain-containing protein [Sphaerochaeta pleomorpha]